MTRVTERGDQSEMVKWRNQKLTTNRVGNKLGRAVVIHLEFDSRLGRPTTSFYTDADQLNKP